MEVQAWRETQKLGGTVKGHLTGDTKKRLCGRGRDPLLLVVPMKPGAKLHEGREGISPGGWQGHMRLKHPFQQCQHHVFLHLPERGWTQRVTLGPALPPLTCPSSVYPQRRAHLQGLSLLTGPLQQEISVFPDAPGCHLHQWLLWGMRNTLGRRLGPFLTSRPCDIPLGSAEMAEFAGVGKGKGLGTGSSYEQFC